MLEMNILGSGGSSSGTPLDFGFKDPDSVLTFTFLLYLKIPSALYVGERQTSELNRKVELLLSDIPIAKGLSSD